MPFDVAIQWTAAGFNARQAFMNGPPQRVAVTDQGWYITALNDAIYAWGMMTMQTFNPGPNPRGSGQVSYQSATAPNPKQLNTHWDCTAQNWSPAGVTLQVTNVY